jgi:hypothetical protein
MKIFIYAYSVCLILSGCDSKKEDSRSSLGDSPGKIVQQQKTTVHERTRKSKIIPKKMIELTQFEFNERLKYSLEKFKINEDISEIEEFFKINKEWAIVAIRQARMPWLLGEIMGNDEETKTNGIQWIRENLSGEERDLCLIGFAQGLGKSDPKSVLAMAEEMKIGLLRDKVLGIAILSTARVDVIGASDLFLEHLDDLERGSLPDLRGWAAGLIFEMNDKLSSSQMLAMMEKPIFLKIMEIDQSAVLWVGDKHPETAVRFSMEKLNDPAPIYAMVFRHVSLGNVDGVNRILEAASKRYSRSEIIESLVRNLNNNEHEPISSILPGLPPTSYDREIFSGAASQVSEDEFNRLMELTGSEERRQYLLDGRGNTQ